jgi:inosose dehydratase
MTNINSFNRRDFMRLAGIAGAAAFIAPNFAFEAAKNKRLIGATGILWGYKPTDLETALKDMTTLGFHGFETFGSEIEDWEKNQGGFTPLVKKYSVPLISAFCSADVLDPAKTQSDIEKLKRWCKLVKANGGTLIEYCADGGRKNYDYKEHKQNMIESMNAYAKAITDEGLVCALHPHTGTPVETQEEVYFVMENVNTKYMKFGPDVGQLQKGGCDPVKIVKDFLPLIEHMHLKDFAGQDQLKNGYLGYCALGQGKVDLKAILDLMEKKKGAMAGMIMYEQDSEGGRNKPANTPLEEATITKDYLVKLGYKFEPKTVASN